MQLVEMMWLVAGMAVGVSFSLMLFMGISIFDRLRLRRAVRTRVRPLALRPDQAIPTPGSRPASGELPSVHGERMPRTAGSVQQAHDVGLGTGHVGGAVSATAEPGVAIEPVLEAASEKARPILAVARSAGTPRPPGPAKSVEELFAEAFAAERINHLTAEPGQGSH